VTVEGRNLGTVVLSYDLEEIDTRRKIFGTILVFIMLISSALAFLFLIDVATGHS